MQPDKDAAGRRRAVHAATSGPLVGKVKKSLKLAEHLTLIMQCNVHLLLTRMLKVVRFGPHGVQTSALSYTVEPRLTGNCEQKVTSTKVT